MSTLKDAQALLAFLQKQLADCKVNDRNQMFAAHQRGQAEGYTIAIEALKINFPELSAPKAEVKKATPYAGMSNDEMYHAMNAQNVDQSLYMRGF